MPERLSLLPVSAMYRGLKVGKSPSYYWSVGGNRYIILDDPRFCHQAPPTARSTPSQSCQTNEHPDKPASYRRGPLAYAVRTRSRATLLQRLTVFHPRQPFSATPERLEVFLGTPIHVSNANIPRTRHKLQQSVTLGCLRSISPEPRSKYEDKRRPSLTMMGWTDPARRT